MPYRFCAIGGLHLTDVNVSYQINNREAVVESSATLRDLGPCHTTVLQPSEDCEADALDMNGLSLHLNELQAVNE